MKRAVTLNGRNHTIDILEELPEVRFAFDGGAVRGASVTSPEPQVYSILIEGRSYDVFVEHTPDGLAISVNGYRYEAAVHDPRQWSRKTAGQGGEGVQTVASPMPGKVVRVLVAPGDAVEPGQGLVVVEAMKMQNEMRASRAGKVLTVPVTPGATVTAGEVLATIG
jgi:biotin carboxyl carrier protein